MVVKRGELKCDRCGAVRKEATLTRSHCPQTAVLKICGERGWQNRQNVYFLCQMCHDVWTQIEKQILRNACTEMEKRHEEYLNQPDLARFDLDREWMIAYKFIFGVCYPENKSWKNIS